MDQNDIPVSLFLIFHNLPFRENHTTSPIQTIISAIKSGDVDAIVGGDVHATDRQGKTAHDIARILGRR